MSFGEKHAWIMFIALAITFAGYGVWLFHSGGIDYGSRLVMIIVVVLLVAEITWAHIRAALETRDPGKEMAFSEEDKRIAQTGEKSGAMIVSIGAVLVFLLAVYEGQWRYANLLLAALVAGELASYGLQIIRHRRR